jgi:hypothetical protein
MNCIEDFARNHFDGTNAATFLRKVATLLRGYRGPNQQSDADFGHECRSLNVFLWKKGRNQGHLLAKLFTFSRWSRQRRDEIALFQQTFVDGFIRFMGARPDWEAVRTSMVGQIGQILSLI